jgi:hypothetical protein
MARSPPGLYEQDWPPTNQKEFSQTDKPPFLPPHLLNIILNKDTSAHVKLLFFVLYNKFLFISSMNPLYYLNQIMLC